jgi:flagellar hook protein FlgE
LAAESSALNVIGNNLANLNTDGYKDQTTAFSDIFNQMASTSGNGDPIQMGSGVKVGAIISNYGDGTPSATGIASNMALQGNGFFVVQDPNNGENSYTRDGAFTVNSAGDLTTSDGQLVLGYPAVDGVVSSAATPVAINVNQQATLPGTATTSFQMTTNLDATGGVGSTFSTPMTIYDSLGNAQTVTVNFTNTAVNAWSYNITIPSSAITGGLGSTTTVTNGNLTFDTSGNLLTPASPVAGIAIKNLADGAANLSLNWDLTGTGGNSLLTQQAATSATAATSQNGYGVGTLTSYSVNPDGTIEGQFTNYQSLTLGQVAVASFANVQGLTQISNGNLTPTAASGEAIIGKAEAGGNGNIIGGSVEESNVNLSTEFSNMIVAQQGYEANAKVLSTMDQLSQATIQLIT